MTNVRRAMMHLQRSALGRFAHAVAYRCSPAACHVVYFYSNKSGGRHLEKSNNRHISAVVLPILTKFGTVKHFEPLDRTER